MARATQSRRRRREGGAHAPVRESMILPTDYAFTTVTIDPVVPPASPEIQAAIARHWQAAVDAQLLQAMDAYTAAVSNTIEPEPAVPMQERLERVEEMVESFRRPPWQAWVWDQAHKAKERGLQLLFDHMTREQRRQYASKGCFEVVGSHSQRRYRIHEGGVQNIHVMNEKGEALYGLCFFPLDVVEGDILLAQKLALELDEGRALAVAHVFEIAPPLRHGYAAAPLQERLCAQAEAVRHRKHPFLALGNYWTRLTTWIT